MKCGPEDLDFNIPATLDVTSGRKSISGGKLFLGLLMIIGGIIFSILILIFSEEGSKLLPALLLMTAVVIFVRFFFFKERYFRKKRRELIQNKYIYDYKMIWNISEISEGFPTIVTFANGLRGIFVAFDKDIIVGKGDTSRYDHHEALGYAYKLMASKKIEAIHIDYMDTVGKDERMGQLFDKVNRCENSDIRKVMNLIYNNVQNVMDNSYASYDVYLFMSRDRGISFWDDAQMVISAFKRANYVREHILSKDEIGDLVESVFNIKDFSVIRAEEQVFAGNTASSYLKVIWKERDGVREVVGKTLEEQRSEARIRNAESGLRVKKKKKVNKNTIYEEDIM